MKLTLALSLLGVCSALSLPSIFGTSTTTPSSPYARAQFDYNRQDGQWVWVPNSALRDIVNTNSNSGYSSSYSSGYNSNGYNSNSGYNSYNSPYNTNSYYGNRQTTTTYSSLFGK